jgi:hypothetical protein
MFSYPKQAEFNRPVPKNRIYAHARPATRIRSLFVAQVDEIIWKYKLSPETVNLPSRNGIHEIQIFEVMLRVPQLDPGVLRSIDRAIPFPLALRLTYNGQVRSYASYKRPSEADPSKWVVEAEFQTEPRPAQTEYPPLPVALDLAGLYEQIVRSHIPLPARPGESLPEHIGRFNTLEAKRKLLRQMESALAAETHFKRKVALNTRLHELRCELAALQH